MVGETIDGTNYIKSASIVASVNSSGSSVIISADHIDLDGYVKASDITANYISSKIADITSVSVQNLVCQAGGYIMSQYFYLGVPGNATDISGGTYMLNLSVEGNTYTLIRTNYRGQSTTLGSWTIPS